MTQIILWLRLIGNRTSCRAIEICPEMHALAKMAEMAINRQIRQTINKNSKRWQRGPLQSGDLGENGVFGENGRNGA